jgi:hypothetical protein
MDMEEVILTWFKIIFWKLLGERLTKIRHILSQDSMCPGEMQTTAG